MRKMEIKELKTKTELLSAFPVMKQLRTHLDESSYLALVKEAAEKDSYRLFALLEEGKIIAVTGFKPMITLYYGRFVWICDLVTAEDRRSRGYGEKLLTFVQEWAQAHGYESTALSSGLQREAAHRFYENKMAYQKASYVFKKDL